MTLDRNLIRETVRRVAVAHGIAKPEAKTHASNCNAHAIAAEHDADVLSIMAQAVHNVADRSVV